MKRYKLTIEYDGTHTLGWQRQLNEHKQSKRQRVSVQHQLEQAIYAYCQERVTVQGSGRTDAGVHARGQVAHVDIEAERSTYSIMRGLNHHLDGGNAVVLAVEEAAPDFHARFDATQRRYLYRIINRSAPLRLEEGRCWHVSRQLDAKAMHDAGQLLVGTHDFSSFRAAECQAQSPVKSIDSITVASHGRELHITIEARSFLHHQVRNIAGALVWVGTGKWNEADLQRVLAAKDRNQSAPTAPACGLYLMEVVY